MAIGDTKIWKSIVGSLPSHREIVFAGIDDIDLGRMELLMPELVVSPVVTPSFDCLDVAHRLADLGFAGAYRALSQTMPDISMIRREVRALYPNLDFDILQITNDGPVRI